MDDNRAPAGREQAWTEDGPAPGVVVAVTDNPIARALVRIVEVVGRPTVLLPDEDVEPTPLQWLHEHPLRAADALVLCDHDTPGMEELLGAALAGEAGYVAMMGSRKRAESVFASLSRTASPQMLQRLHVPAGLNTGGRAPGEIALSVVAEIIAVSHGRDGGPMRPSEAVPGRS